MGSGGAQDAAAGQQQQEEQQAPEDLSRVGTSYGATSRPSSSGSAVESGGKASSVLSFLNGYRATLRHQLSFSLLSDNLLPKPLTQEHAVATHD